MFVRSLIILAFRLGLQSFLRSNSNRTNGEDQGSMEKKEHGYVATYQSSFRHLSVIRSLSIENSFEKLFELKIETLSD